MGTQSSMAYGHSPIGIWDVAAGYFRPLAGATWVIPSLAVSHRPALSARRKAARGGPQLASPSLAIRLQFTTIQVSSTWIVALARPQQRARLDRSGDPTTPP